MTLNSLFLSVVPEMCIFLFKMAEAILEPPLRTHIYHRCVDWRQMDLQGHPIDDPSGHRGHRWQQESISEGEAEAAETLLTYRIICNSGAFTVLCWYAFFRRCSTRRLPVLLTSGGSSVAVVVLMCGLAYPGAFLHLTHLATDKHSVIPNSFLGGDGDIVGEREVKTSRSMSEAGTGIPEGWELATSSVGEIVSTSRYSDDVLRGFANDTGYFGYTLLQHQPMAGVVGGGVTHQDHAHSEAHRQAHYNSLRRLRAQTLRGSNSTGNSNSDLEDDAVQPEKLHSEADPPGSNDTLITRDIHKRRVQHRWWLACLLLSALVRGITGKSATISMALHSHVADHTSTQLRTKRFGRLLSMNFFGYTLGCLISGGVVQVTGSYAAVFACVLVAYAAVYTVASLGLQDAAGLDEEGEEDSCGDDCSILSSGSDGDSVELCKKGLKTEAASTTTTTATAKLPPGGESKDVATEETYLRKSVITLIKLKDSKPSRKVITRALFICLFAIGYQQATKAGETDVIALTVMSSPFSWNSSTLAYLTAVDYVCLGGAVLFILPVIIRCIKYDLSIVIMGIGFKVIRLTMYSLADKSWQIFLACVISCPSALIISGLKSAISKMTATGSRTTKIFAVLACVEIASSGLGAVVMEWAFALLSRANKPGLPPSTTVFLTEILGFTLVMAMLGALALGSGVNTTTTGGQVVWKPRKSAVAPSKDAEK